MRLSLIIDTNIIISALVKDSITRKILLHEDVIPLVIDYAIDEMKKYEAKIIETASIKHNFQKAESMIGMADQGDIPFVAAAITIQNDGIWTYDTHFDSIKGWIKIWNTKELA